MLLKLRENFPFGGPGIVLHDSRNAHNHTRRAITTLERALIQKCFLHRMQLVPAGQPFNGLYRLIVYVANGGDAGWCGAAIEQYGAGSAFALAATIFCPGQLQILAQHLKQ